MADRLIVSTSQLKNTAQEFVRRKKDLEQTCARIDGIAHGTSEFWFGTANDAFVNRFSSMYGELKQTDDKMQDAVDELLKTAGIFEESETKNTGVMQSLDTGVSPFLA